MAYRQHDLHHAKTGSYDKMFHKNTGSHNPNNVKRFKGNQQILDYHLFSGQYEQQKKSIDMDKHGYSHNPIETFNQNIDKIQMPFDMQRPMATRDQIKEEYELENKSLYTQQKANNYFKDHHLFRPNHSGSGGGSGGGTNRFDFYSMQQDDGDIENGFEDFF